MPKTIKINRKYANDIQLFYRLTYYMPAVPPTCPDRKLAVVITGTSTGIGRDAAERLAAAGFTVFAGARKQTDLDSLAAIEGIIPIRLDVTMAEDIKNARLAVETWRAERPDRYLVGLVNNAGHGVNTCVEEAAGETIRNAYEVLVFGVVDLTAALLPQLRETAQVGRIVPRILNVISAGVYLSLPIISVYTSAKIALKRLTDVLRQELYGFNIRVIDITPGSVRTQIFVNASVHRPSTPLEPLAQKHYDDFHESWKKVQQQSENNSIKVSVTSNAIEHAICSPRPKIRYHLGTDTMLARFVGGFVSSALMDKIALTMVPAKPAINGSSQEKNS
ncbi:hypothetical protein BDF19DRAFT_435259 [Syncephalis fuscata]|nr:hypothetical protein BDF19DRAFT_435259 [Syncephalis fuscata]